MKRHHHFIEGCMIFWIIALIVGALSIGVYLLSPTVGWAEESKITILHTNNVTGHLFACPT